jgi:hypothetical protein
MLLRIVGGSLVVLLLVGVAAGFAEDYQSGSFILTEEQVDALRERSLSGVVTGVGNVLVNPGFEDGALPPWTTNNWTVTNADSNSGTFSAEDIGNFWVEQAFTPVDVSTILSVTLFSRQPEEAIQAVDFYYGAADFDEFLIFPLAAWGQFDVTSELRGAGQLERIRIWGYSGGGADPDLSRIDDVDIQSTTIPVEVLRFTVD